jgi:hypothetical protein
VAVYQGVVAGEVGPLIIQVRLALQVRVIMVVEAVCKALLTPAVVEVVRVQSVETQITTQGQADQA